MDTKQSLLPLVIIIDLDGTIIGDITPQIMSYELAKALKTANVRYTFDQTDFRVKLKHGLIRPYFETFVKALKTHFANVEFFVYTASEKTWAEFVIKNIEQVTGIKFNRPIFSRNNCVNQDRQYTKGLQFVYPHILKCLKKKYGVMFSKKDLVSNVLLIDNNDVYQSHENKHLIVCPSYNFRVPENIVANIKVNVFKNHYNLITSVLKKYIPINTTSDYNLFQKEYYSVYTTFLEQVIKHNTRYAHDKFWLHLKDIIISQNINRFDERNVKYIINVLRQRIGSSSTSHSSIAHLGNPTSSRTIPQQLPWRRAATLSFF